MSDPEPTFRLCDIAGKVQMGPTIYKTEPDGTVLMGHRMTHYNWKGEVEKVEDCYAARLTF